jgi:hypothetical protein
LASRSKGRGRVYNKTFNKDEWIDKLLYLIENYDTLKHYNIKFNNINLENILYI